MSITVISHDYSTRNHPSGNNFPLSNSFQQITESVDVVCEFDFQSTFGKQVLIIALNQIQLLGGIWDKKGYVVGDSVSIYGTINNGISVTFPPLTLNILSITSDIMTLSGSLDSGSTGIVVGQIMPMQSGALSNTAMGIMNNSRNKPQTIDIFHNVIPNLSNSGTQSLFDGEVNKFNFENISTLAIGGTSLGVQQGDKSGGSYLDYSVVRLTDVAAVNWSFTSMVNVSYRITLTYMSTLKFNDADFLKPYWFQSNNSVKPFYSINARSQANNPNSVLTQDYSGQLGNIGWLDESYNQGVNEFLISTIITDGSGIVLSKIDPSQSCIITAVITHPTLIFLETCEVEFYLIPELIDVKNKPERNCDLIQLSNLFIDATPTIVSQVFGTGGALMNTNTESIDVSTSGQIIIQFTLDPNAAFTSLIDSMGSASRRCVITATVESAGGTSNVNNAVPLTIYQDMLETAPITGSHYPVRSQGFFNHSNDITGVLEGTYKGCTEDDFLYQALLNLTQGDVWNGIELKIQVVRDSDFETFDLVSKFVNLTNYIVNLDGEIQVNYTDQITQYLESTDRNKLEISLTGNDSGTDYEVEILWSLMASWRYWIPQTNAFLDFFNGALPSNGMSNEWMRYLRTSGYSLRVRINLLDANNTPRYFGAGIELQDYDASPSVVTTIEYYNSAGVQQGGLVANDIMTIKSIHTLSSGVWDVNDTWGWNDIRPFKNEPNKRISNVWDWSSQSNPLMPPPNETKATLTFPSPNVVVVESQVNTTMISVGTSTVIARVESPKNPECVSPVDYLFDQVVSSSDSELDYPEILEAMLIKGIRANNICCPDCDVLNNVTGLLDNVYSFGSDLSVPNPLSPYNGNPVCCLDSYATVADCNTTFDSDWDAFMLTLSGVGDTTLLTAMTPSQVNTYSGVSMVMFISKIQSITSNLSIQYSLMYVLLNKGIQIICLNGGDKVIHQYLV